MRSHGQGGYHQEPEVGSPKGPVLCHFPSAACLSSLPHMRSWDFQASNPVVRNSQSCTRDRWLGRSTGAPVCHSHIPSNVTEAKNPSGCLRSLPPDSWWVADTVKTNLFTGLCNSPKSRCGSWRASLRSSVASLGPRFSCSSCPLDPAPELAPIHNLLL